MADDKDKPQDKPPKSMSAADAAKLVCRTSAEVGDDGRPTGKLVETPLEADEVFAFKDHGDHVVVVTVDGQKLRGAKKRA